MKVALYSRVSTLEQTVEPQLLELRAYCTQKGWAIAHEFTDTISGTKAARPGLDSLLLLVRARQIDAVCAVKIDRMARSMQHFANLASELIKYDVALICTSQGIDTSKSNPCGRFQVNILASVAELERDLISERTKAGLVVARLNGKKIGRTSPKMPGHLERVRIVNDWHARGGSYEELGAALGGVSRGTAWRIARKLGLKVEPPPSLEVEI